MGKIFKLAILTIALSLVCVGAAIADPPPAEIPIDIDIPTSFTFSVQSRNITNDAAANPSFNVAGVSIAAPWRVSDQYLFVEYSANTAKWGVRIITDNLTAWPLLVGNKIGSGEAAPGPYDWNDGDEILSYAGIINTGALDNPSMRAALGWQVYADKVAKPANPTDANFSAPSSYNSPWAYMADLSNNVANADGTRKMNGAIPVLAGDEGIVTGTTAGGDLIFNYALAAYGGIGQALAQHPEVLPNKVANDSDINGTYDIAVYLAARFASTDYGTGSAVDFVLPGGAYSTKLYVELLHE